MKKLNKFLASPPYLLATLMMIGTLVLQTIFVQAFPDEVSTRIGILKCITSHNDRVTLNEVSCYLKNEQIAQVSYSIAEPGSDEWKMYQDNANHYNESFGILRDLKIKNSAQNKGIGSILFNLVVEDLKTHNISLMRWLATPLEERDKFNSLIKFYQSLGGTIYHQYLNYWACMELDISKNQNNFNENKENL